MHGAIVVHTTGHYCFALPLCSEMSIQILRYNEQCSVLQRLILYERVEGINFLDVPLSLYAD